MIIYPAPVNTCIIDNNSTYVYGFKKLLSIKELSQHVIHFNNGSEAITYFKQQQHSKSNLPDIIFLDISMPVMNGWEFMKEFEEIKLQIGKNIPVYILSCSVDQEDIDRAKKIPGIIDYIFKTTEVERLKEIFNNINLQ